jgi:hypothetical protein
MVQASEDVGGVVMADKARYGTPIAVRIPDDLAKRLDRLMPKLLKDPTLRTFGRVSRSSVVKLALLRGVVALEAEYK